MMERSFREAMMISRGYLGVFIHRPISGSILAVGLLVVVAPAILQRVRALLGRAPGRAAISP